MNDLEAKLRASAPRPDIRTPDLTEAAVAAGLLDVAVATTDTPVGRLVLARTDKGLVTCSYDDEDAVLDRLARRVSPRVLRAPGRLDEVRRQLDEYFAGRRHRFEVGIDWSLAGEFGRAVLRRTSEVPYGSTTTYATIARAIGHPSANRAVGNALGANPLCVVVPCHRVVRSTGGLGGYAGGLPAKELLLRLEGAA